MTSPRAADTALLYVEDLEGSVGPSASNHRRTSTCFAVKLLLATLGLFAAAACSAQDIPIGATYVCEGEHIYVEACNMRDTSDTSTCMVAHPDKLTPSGMNTYTNMTRAALKKLLPTCQQPSAKQLAAAAAFQKKQQDLYNANAQKANDQLKAATQPVQYGQPQKPRSADERAMNRCITSGRLPASCTGNALLGAFSQMLTSVLSSGAQEVSAGPTMAGVFEGAGHWRLDFIDGGVLVNCSFLSPNQESYKLEFKPTQTLLIVETKPKPLVLTLKADGSIVGPGPVTINGVVATGTAGGHSTPGHTETHSTTTTEQINGYEAAQHAGDSGLANRGGGQYDYTHTTTQSTYVPGTSTPAYSTFSPRTATCPAQNLSSKGASTGIQTMQTDLLKTMFGGDKGPPTPSGIRMHGIYAAATGFSVQFFPESAVLGCGPDAARAYPYSVEAVGGKAEVRINAPDHPLTLGFMPNGSLDPRGTGPYQVHGRVITGQGNNDDFTFAPLEQSCNLAVLTPSKAIPSSGGTAATIVASSGASGVSPANGGGNLSTSAAPLGNATLSIVSGFPAQPGVPNPLAGHPYVLLRDSYAGALAKAGITVPAGMSPYKYVGTVCASRTPDCQKSIEAIKADAASSVRADSNGNGTFPGVAPGSYHLMISTRYNNQALMWEQAVQLKAGPNSVTLDPRNATPVQ
ncbi:MAG TPA: hypothetical protein VE779_16905 [Candidatus Angelobacter sp.]|nr:hypothetical protein [Candidatus Angelobacter sp.]